MNMNLAQINDLLEVMGTGYMIKAQTSSDDRWNFYRVDKIGVSEIIDNDYSWDDALCRLTQSTISLMIKHIVDLHKELDDLKGK